MPRFNKKDFGNNLKKFRKAKGLSQFNLACVINKSQSTIGRFENGSLLPNAEEISLLCDELHINESDLFQTSSDKIVNIDNSKNPFKCKELFLIYNAFSNKNKTYTATKFKIILIDKPECCIAEFRDYKTNQLYMIGHILSDTNMAVLIFENYKDYSPRLEVTEIILNISNGINGIMRGTLSCTNGNYVPSIRKCIISKNDITIDDSITNILNITNDELLEAKETGILYLDTSNKYDFEN